MPVIIGDLVHVHTDERRSISELNSPDGGFSVQSFEIMKSIPLGNHYHRNKFEVFIILRGMADLIIQDINPEDSSPIGEPISTRVGEGMAIKILPFTAHTFTFVSDPDPQIRPLESEPAEMICFSSQPFDQSDLIQHKLV